MSNRTATPARRLPAATLHPIPVEYPTEVRISVLRKRLHYIEHLMEPDRRRRLARHERQIRRTLANLEAVGVDSN